MGRLVLFLIVIAAALAGVWFYAPGGKDMLLGAKSTVMGMVGKAEPAAEPVADAVDEAAGAVDEAAGAVEDAVDDTAAAAEEPAEAAEDAAADPQN